MNKDEFDSMLEAASRAMKDKNFVMDTVDYLSELSLDYERSERAIFFPMFIKNKPQTPKTIFFKYDLNATIT